MNDGKYEIPRITYDKENGITGILNKTANENTKDSRSTDDELGPHWKIWKRRRYVVAFLAFLGFFNVYALRVNLSVAIVAMTTDQIITQGNNTITHPREFDWDSKQIGLVLSSFFYGYILTQIPGGWLSAKIGGNVVFCVGVAVTAVLTILTPPLAKMSFHLLLAIRIVEGFFEGVTYPCIHAMWSNWAPPLERSKLATIAFSGSYMGTVVSLPLCGLIANKLGWEAIFYIFGIVGVLWCIVWGMVVKRAPEYDPHISRKELQYIEESLGKTRNKKIIHPWKSFITSFPVWAIVVAHVCENWGFYTMLTQLPTFMRDTLGFQIEKAGFMSSLPYLAMTIVLQLSGQLADYLRSNGILSTTNVRKLFNCGAFISQMIFMMLASYLTTSVGIIICLTIAVGLGGFAWSGFSVNHLDIAPQHASVLMGLSNTFATLPGMISPILTGYIVQNKSASEWKIIFYIASAIYISGAVFYGFFASGERQPWAEDSQDEEVDRERSGYVNKGIDDTT